MPRSSVATGIALTLAVLALAVWTASGPSDPGSVSQARNDVPRDRPGVQPAVTAKPLARDATPTELVTAAQPVSAADGAQSAPAPSGTAAPLLTGSLVLPHGFTRAMFRVTFRRPGEQTALPIHLAADGSFRLFHATPGMVAVSVDLRDDPPPLATILDVEIPSVGTNADPRLQHIAFPDLRQITLRVVDEVGAPIAPQIGVLALTPGTDAGRRWFRQGGASITLPARYRPQRVQVWSTGREAVELDVDDDATVVLPRSAVVAFHFRVDPTLRERHGFRLGVCPVGGRLEPARALPPPGMRMGDAVQAGQRRDVTVDPGSVALRRTSGPSSPAALFGGETNQKSPCLVSCAVAGTYQVVWTTVGEDPVVHGHGPAFEVVSGQRLEVEFALTPEVFAATRR